MECFEQLWDSALPAFARQTTHRRAGTLAMAALACLGRHTMSGIISTTGTQFNDWSANYRLVARGRYDHKLLFGAVTDKVQSIHAPGQPFECALDDTHVAKQGKTVHGAKWRRDKLGPKFQCNLVWSQRYLQISAVAAAPSDEAPACMVPVEFLHCPSPVKLARDATASMKAEHREVSRQMALPTKGVQALHSLRERVDSQRTILCSGDGGYTNRTVLKALPANTTFIGRIRKDAKLFAAPSAQPATGRRRRYGEQLPTPDQLRCDEATPWQTVQVHLGGKLRDLEVKTCTVRWKSAGPRDLKLVIIRPLKYKLSPKGRTLYRDPVYLIATDPLLDTQSLVQNYVNRWGIEQNFRDEKQVVGVGENYMRTATSVQAMPALLVAGYAMLRLACRQGGCNTLPRPKWNRQGPHNPLTANHEIALLRHGLWARALGMQTNSFSGFAPTTSSNPKPPKLQNTLASAVLYASRC